MIIQNEAQCAKCKEIIFSVHRNDFNSCECGAIAVYGGQDYIKRVGNRENIIERSIIHKELDPLCGDPDCCGVCNDNSK